MTPRLSAFEHLLRVRRTRGAGFVVLIDPDKLPVERLGAFAEGCTQAGVDAFFLGGSLLDVLGLDAYVARLKAASPLPVIGFPGHLTQVVPGLDAVLFLSIVSGRNPEFLIGQHVYAAPLVRRLGLEAIPTAYMLVESGRPTTAQYMSGSPPLPRHKPDIAAATALAAEMLGMRLLFTDGGSGADEPVPEEMIHAITTTCTAPLVVGGGLRTPSAVASRVAAGAGFVVVGNAFERSPDVGLVAELAAAAHEAAVVSQ
ncbi:MAG TPA: geranylgeranylglyceryl/heptaprenylglyceryl phosphate synthase [Rhodothermales bacterium]|nr:geranylgeranylglyceryl/heptaprenylglyceryl phosphate synthase [Rhodothermales bacterium]